MGEPIVFRNKIRSIAVIWLVILAAMLQGCSNPMAGYTKYSYEFLGSFDTVVQFIGYAKNQSEFEGMAKSGETRFMELHRLFDIYNDYDGINNIKTINDNAGVEPVRVSQEIIDLIEFSKAWHDRTGGTVNIAMGPVLSIWHEYREHGLNNPDDASLPPMERLIEAKSFATSIKSLWIPMPGLFSCLIRTCGLMWEQLQRVLPLRLWQGATGAGILLLPYQCRRKCQSSWRATGQYTFKMGYRHT